MKKIFLLIIIFSLTFLTACTNENETLENISSSLENQKFPDNLTLENGLEIILPLAKKWSDDAVLQYLKTNIITNENKYKANVYGFESVKKRKGLIITYNYKSSANGYGIPESWELNNKFNFKEEDYWEPGVNIKDIAKYLSESKYNELDNYLKSEKIIELAKKEGIEDFIRNHQGMKVYSNDVWLFESSSSDDIKWEVSYFFINDNPEEPYPGFVASFDPVSGELIYKRIRSSLSKEGLDQ